MRHDLEAPLEQGAEDLRKGALIGTCFRCFQVGVSKDADCLGIIRHTHRSVEFGNVSKPLAASHAVRSVAAKYSATFEMQLTPAGAALLHSFTPRRRDSARGLVVYARGNASTATFLTLAKRMAYGGRKGRRAIRRMQLGVWGPTPVDARFELERGAR